MAFVSEADARHINEAIRQVEARTSGELVTVIARAADPYPYVPLLWSSMLALLVPGILWLAGLATDVVTIYAAQILAFLGFAALFHWPPLKHLLVPTSVQHRQAGRLAREQFYAQGLHLTRGRTGVLLFVSVAERYVEILADEGIHQRVPEGTWDRVVAEFVGRVREGRIAEGFLSAIAACGDILAAQCPREPDDRNELPDRLVQI